MNDYIKRYVYDVTRRLPENQREEVGKELLANIMDMLPDNANEEAIKSVLIELGDPRLLAASYRIKPRYLISPEWMDDYLQVLKIVLVIFGIVSLVTGLIDNIMNPESENVFGIIFEVFFSTIGQIIEGLLSAFTIVTLIFAGISAHQSKTTKSTWDPEHLPEIPKDNVKKISKAESIIGLTLTVIFGSIFIYLVWHNQFYIGWFEDGNIDQILVPFFSENVLIRFLPIIVISVLLTVVIEIMKLKTGYWTITIAALHTADKVISIIIVFLLSTVTSLVNPEFWTEVAQVTNLSAAAYSEGFSKGFYAFAWFIAVMGTIDVITTWFKTLKPKQKGINAK